MLPDVALTVRARRAAVVLAALSLGACGDATDAPASCDLPQVPAAHCGAAHALRLPDALPRSRGNDYGDNEQAAHLGLSLFFDPNLGRGVSCASCHLPELAFADRRPVSTGKQTGNRNSPTTFNAARLSVFFWDGRADSLWSQPLIPIENPAEMASTRLELAQRILLDYRARYEAVFGALPDVAAWPPVGKPGDAAFDQLSVQTRAEVNRLFSNIGKALDAFMRKSTTGRADLDAFLDGDHGALLEPAQRGLAVFLRGGCADCHGGPMLTDEAFHKVEFPSLPNATPDRGRAGGLEQLRTSEFSLSGPFADRG
ncbi:MAG TPA: cytochrome-c peroxidase, partial [Polyangiales bacterium]